MIQALGEALLHFLWQGTLLALLAGVALAAVARADSAARHAIGLGAVVLALCTFAGTFAHALAGSPGEAGAQAVAQFGADEVPLSLLLAGAAETPPWPDPRTLLAWAWGLGILLMVLRLGRGHAWARGVLRGAVVPAEPTWQRVVDELCRDLGIRGAVRLLQNGRIESPAVIGWLEPVVVVPLSTLLGLTPDQLRSVLAHELAHVRRLDHLVNALLALAEVVLFFHPAIWWLARLVRGEREHCCDLVAVRTTGNPRLLAAALAELESLRITRPAPALAARTEGGPLMQRITRILAMNPIHADRTGGRRLLSLFTVAALLAGAGFVRSAVAEPSRAAPAWSLASPQDPESDYRIIEKRILVAVEAGQLSSADAARTLEAVRRTMKLDPADARVRSRYADQKSRYRALEEEIGAAARAGMLSAEEAQRKPAGLRETLFAESGAGAAAGGADSKGDFKAAVKKIKASVKAGELSGEEAERKIEGLERRLREMDADREGRIDGTERELGAAGRAGRFLREDAGARSDYEGAVQRVKDAVKAGKLSPEDAERAVEGLKKRLREADADSDSKAAKKRIKEAVKNGDLSPEDAKRKFEDLESRTGASGEERRARFVAIEERLFAAMHSDEPLPVTLEEYRRAEAELREIKAAGQFRQEEARRRLRDLRLRIVKERADGGSVGDGEGSNRGARGK